MNHNKSSLICVWFMKFIFSLPSQLKKAQNDWFPSFSSSVLCCPSPRVLIMQSPPCVECRQATQHSMKSVKYGQNVSVSQNSRREEGRAAARRRKKFNFKTPGRSERSFSVSNEISNLEEGSEVYPYSIYLFFSISTDSSVCTIDSSRFFMFCFPYILLFFVSFYSVLFFPPPAIPPWAKLKSFSWSSKWKYAYGTSSREEERKTMR